ncbi:MAG: hypothetical protein WB475_09980, partial [Pseudolabrys sp.]
VAEAEAAVVIMHTRAEKDENLDIIADIRRFSERSLSIAARAGIPKQHTILDSVSALPRRAGRIVRPSSGSVSSATMDCRLWLGHPVSGFLAR